MKLIIQKIFLISLFVFPFVFLNSSYFPTVSTKAFFVETVTLLLFGLLLVDVIRNKNSTLNKSIFFSIFGIYTLVNIVSSLHGIVPSLSFWGDIDRSVGTIFVIHILFLSYVIFSVFRTREDWDKIFRTLILSNVVIFLGTIISFLSMGSSLAMKSLADKGFTFGNSSFAGLYLSFIFFISLASFFYSEKKWQKVFSLSSAILVFLNPIITGFLFEKQFFGQARAALLSIIAGSIIFILYFCLRKIKKIKWRKVFVGVCIAVFAFGTIFVLAKPSFVKNIMMKNEGGNRLVFWNIAKEGFKEKPILGWGGSTYHIVYGKYFDPIITTPGYMPEYWVDRSHNIFFDELVSSGIVGLMSLILLYGFICFGLIRQAYREIDTKYGFVYIGVFAGFVAFLLQGLLIFQLVAGWLIVGLVSAFVAVFCFKNKELNIGNNFLYKNKIFLSSLVVCLSFAGIFYFVIKPYKISNELAILYSTNITTWDQRMKFYQDIDQSYVGNTSDLGDVFLSFFKQLRDMIGRSDFSESSVNGAMKEIDAINNLLENSLKKEKYLDAKVLMAQIEFYSLKTILVDGKPDQKVFYEKGLSYVEKMKAISPLNPLLENAEKLMEFSIK